MHAAGVLSVIVLVVAAVSSNAGVSPAAVAAEPSSVRKKEELLHSSSISEASWARHIARIVRRVGTEQGGEINPPPPPCPAQLFHAVSQTGLLSVQLFAEFCGNVTWGGTNEPDAACMAQAAINASKSCGGAIFFPPTLRGYKFLRTVFIDGPGVAIVGAEKVGDGAEQFAVAPQAAISGLPPSASSGVSFSDLMIEGTGAAIVVKNSNCIRMRNVAAQALNDVDGVNTTAAGCDGCNVQLGSWNAAVIVENSFWVWFEDCVFHFLPAFDVHGHRNPSNAYGQRPAVILRGNHSTPFHGVDTTYLIRFDRCMFSGGAVQYQQLTLADQWPGQFDFNWCTLENSAVALLDLQGSGSTEEAFAGLHTVNIHDFAFADNLQPNYLKNHTLKRYPSYMGGAWTPAVSVNCSMQDCAINGLFMAGIDTSESHAPAVRIYSGQVNPATIYSNTMMGGQDILNVANQPAGGYVTRSVGGWTMASPAKTCPTRADCRQDNTTQSSGQILSGGSDFALLVGETGGKSEGNASWGLSHDGTTHHWAPDGTAHTALKRHMTATRDWDPPALATSAMTKVSVAVAGAAKGDVCVASLTSMEGLGQLTCNVVGEGIVDVVLMVGEPLDVANGTARVVVSRFV